MRSDDSGPCKVGRSIFNPGVSISSGPAMIRIAASRSNAERASGPITEMSVGLTLSSRTWPRGGTRPQVGLWPNTPQKWAGLRIEPPMSLPISRPVRPAARAAADPPDEPPGVRSRLQGLLVVP